MADPTTITCAQAETAINAGRAFGCKSPREREEALLAYLASAATGGGGGGGSGTVTSVSVVTANGLAGTVATATTTPAITLSGTLTGDVTGPLTAATIGTGAVTLAKMADLAQDQFIGRTTASTGVPQTATITAAARTVLGGTTVSAMVDTLGGASATGSGGLVRATSPTLVTPTIGAASATSLNGNTFTTGTYTLTGAAGKTLTFNKSITLDGTDGTTMTFPSTSQSIAGLGQAQTFVGLQTIPGITISGGNFLRLQANNSLVQFGTSLDVTLGRQAAANLRLGTADAAAPVGQTLSVQSVVGGTSNTAGAVTTFTDSAGTGTGGSGGYLIKVAPSGSSGTSQNAFVTALTIASDLSTTFAGVMIHQAPNRLKGYTVATLPAGTQGDTAFVTDALAPAFITTVAGGGAVVTEVFYNGTNWIAS